MTEHRRHIDRMNAMAATGRRESFFATASAFFDLSQTQRRLAHDVRREALEWEAGGNYEKFAACMLEGRRLWRDAKWHLDRARMNLERSIP